jgi:hypothetical protein
MDLSIIIPAYCPEFFLCNLIERLKIIDKKLLELKISTELIFIHNGSKYSLLKQLPKLKAIKFQYYMVHERLTPASARNIGISCSNGRYLMFHDVDDLLNLDFPDALHTITQNLIKKTSYDLIIFKYRKIRHDGSQVISHGLKKSNYQLNSQDIEKYINLYIEKPHIYTLFVHCWSKLYLRSFLEKNKIVFNPKLNQLEDVNFNFKILNMAPSVYFCKGLCYDYMISNSSANLSAKSGVNGNVDIKNTIKAFLPIKKYLQDKNNKKKTRKKLGHLYATTFVVWIIRITKKIRERNSFKIIIKEYLNSKTVQLAIRRYVYLRETSWIIPLLIRCNAGEILSFFLVIKYGENGNENN